ncbi:MAG: hypothetical protein KDI44_19285 [Thiothrix sp.]|nr:hypothetical protein [Thiothrix sp.]
MIRKIWIAAIAALALTGPVMADEVQEYCTDDQQECLLVYPDGTVVHVTLDGNGDLQYDDSRALTAPVTVPVPTQAQVKGVLI